LSGSALRYLKLAVDEELAHRAEPPPLPAEDSSSEPGS